MHDRPSSSFRRVKKYSVSFDDNWVRAKITSAGFRDSFALPVAEIKLCKEDLCKDEFHRRKQLAKITVKKFIDLGFIGSEELLEDMMDKRTLHPARVIIVGTMFNRKKREAKK